MRPLAPDRRALELGGHAAYGWCAAHSHPFWGFRLFLACSPDGMPRGFCLAPANEPECEVAAALLERTLTGDETVVGDEGLAGEEFEQIVAALGARLVRPDRRDKQPLFGSLGDCRQWIESIIDTLKGQFSLERHGGRTLAGVWVRVCQRLLAPAAGVSHNWQLNHPGRGFTAYDH